MRFAVGRRRRGIERAIGWLLAAAVCGLMPRGAAQTELNFSRLGGVVRIVNTDMAVLESPENRNDLPCLVTPLRPELAFDLRFHAGYRVTIPLKDLAGGGDQLRALIRVTPLDKPDNQIYLVDRFNVPAIEEDAKGEASLPGGFTLGPGRYKVDWLMRDRAERVCSWHWDAEAVVDPGNKDLPLTMAANTVGERPQEPFSEQTPVERASADRLLHVKILANFSPTTPRETTMKPWDVEAIVSILRSIAREPQIGRFSLIAFNMQEQRVIFREDNVERIDFPALGEAVGGIKLGTVDYRKLQDPLSSTRFLTSLLSEQLGPQTPEPDAIVITGPKLMLEKNVSRDALKEAGRASCPIFYLNYNFNPRNTPWRDAIGSALKVYRGLEYSITLPRDLGAALTDMMFRVNSGAQSSPPRGRAVEAAQKTLR
ncbi:MAG TPA: acetyltransferase [Bryobacterales bacterium]|nr:acetyltransferase [Bryobacterales bacterium]